MNEMYQEALTKYRRVKGHPMYGVNAKGEVINIKTERPLKPEVVIGNYKRVKLDGEYNYIHKLVAEAFIPNVEDKKYVIHINGDHGDNFYKNLRWSNNYKS